MHPGSQIGAVLQVPNHRLHRLSPLEPLVLLRDEGFEATAVDHLHRHQVIHSAVAQVSDGRGGLDVEVLQQVGALLDRLGQPFAEPGATIG